MVFGIQICWKVGTIWKELGRKGEKINKELRGTIWHVKKNGGSKN